MNFPHSRFGINLETGNGLSFTNFPHSLCDKMEIFYHKLGVEILVYNSELSACLLF